MKELDVTEATGTLAQLAGAPEPLVITRDGAPLLVVMPIDQEDYDSMLLSRNPEFRNHLRNAKAKNEWLTHDEIWNDSSD